MYFVRRQIEKDLKKLDLRRVHKPKKISSVGCIIDGEVELKPDQLDRLAEMFGIQPHQLYIMWFYKKPKSAIQEPFFSKNDINWRGQLKSKTLEQFILHSHDVMIHFFVGSDPYLMAVAAKTKAHFRIGFSSTDSRLNDLVLDDQMVSFEVFSKNIPPLFTKIKTLE